MLYIFSGLKVNGYHLLESEEELELVKLTAASLTSLLDCDSSTTLQVLIVMRNRSIGEVGYIRFVIRNRSIGEVGHICFGA